MIPALTLFVLAVLISTAVFQSIYVWVYIRRLGTSRLANPETSEDVVLLSKPDLRTAVILCLRGGDPSLINCLNSINELDYSNYQLHCVFDDKSDPAIALVKNFFQQNQMNASFHWLDERSQHGGLKCQALIKVIESLEPEIEVVALVDADTVVDRDWLSDLLRPMSDESIAAVSGNRWFAPEVASIGSFVRQVWNAGAIVQMLLYNIPWGGSLAIRHSVIKEAGLIEKWKTAFCEDTMLPDVLAEHNLKVLRVPDLIVPNDEATTLSGAKNWISRQLLTARLYHSAWPLVLGHAVAVALGLIGAVAALVITIANGAWFWAIVLAAAVAILQIVNAALVAAITKANRNLLAQRLKYADRQPEDPGKPLAFAIAMFLTQIIQPIAAFRAAMMRKVTWRGIEYTINRDNSVTMDKYIPYVQVTQEVEAEELDSIQ